jgi:hypothetical protein
LEVKEQVGTPHDGQVAAHRLFSWRISRLSKKEMPSNPA